MQPNNLDNQQSPAVVSGSFGSTPAAPAPSSSQPAPQQWFAPDSTSSSEASATPTADAADKSKVKVGIFVAVVALVVFAGGYFANNALNNAAQSSAPSKAKAFIAALNSGDTTKAYAMTTSSLHSQQTESQFADALGDVKASKPSYQDQSIAFNGRSATFTLTEDGLPPTADGNTTGTFTVALVRSGLTGWKVDSVDIE